LLSNQHRINQHENGETPSGQYRANPVLESVKTMTYTDKKQIVKLLSYMSTFDGGLYKQSKSGNANFILNMRKENLDYVKWIQSVLDNVTSSTITELPNYNKDDYNRQPLVRLESKVHPFLTKLHSRIYIDRTKVLDPHMLKMMDAESLAIIFMTDGGTHLDMRFKNPHGTISLHTKGFSYADNMALSKAIYKATKIRTNINRHNKYYFLRVKTKDLKLFVSTVLPYIRESFMYKLQRLAPLYEGGEIV